jgi:hypothetical protein
VGCRRQSGISVAALLPLVLAAIVATGSWRLITSGVDGANIGGALVAVAAPLAVATLLFASLVIERRSRDGGVPYYRLIAVLVWATAPALFTLVWVLSR